MTKGGLNLVALGVSSIVIALATTSVSLIWYHNSGDIYLDRSRPGYLPDEEEVDPVEPEEDYEFSKTGLITQEVLREYLEAFQAELEGLDNYKTPFAAEVLSDESLGIQE